MYVYGNVEICRGDVRKWKGYVATKKKLERWWSGAPQAREQPGAETFFTEVNCRFELSSVASVVVANLVLDCWEGTFALACTSTEHLILAGGTVSKGNIDL